MLIHKQTSIDPILELAQTLNTPACVAGSCVYMRHLPEFEPTDIDVYIRDPDGEEYQNFIEQLLCTDEYEDIGQREKPKYQFSNKVTGTGYVKETTTGMIVNVTGFGSSAPEAHTSEVITSFDYTITMLGYDLDDPEHRITKSVDRDAEFENGTLTLVNVPSRYHLTVMGKRLEKMQERFPNRRVVIKDDFYKAPQDFRAKKKKLGDDPIIGGWARQRPIVVDNAEF